MSDHKANRAVRTLASIVLIPKVVLELPKAALQNIKDFNEDVREEVDLRKAKVRSHERTIKA